MRLAPPVVTGIERLVTEDMMFSGEYQLKKGTMVMGCHIANHHNPEYFNEP